MISRGSAISALVSVWMTTAAAAYAADGDLGVVSLIALLGDEKSYAGKQIITVGVIEVDFESHCLYLTVDHFKNRITSNALWLDWTDKSPEVEPSALRKLNGMYVAVEGKFVRGPTGHLGANPGAITSIKRITQLKASIADQRHGRTSGSPK